MHNPSARIILYSSLAIVLLVFMWGLRQIPSEGHLADQALRESLNQEMIVLGGAVKASTQAMKYRLLDVLKAEGNDHVTRTFQDSPFLAATLLEWDQVQWKSLWYSNKSKTDLQSTELKEWLAAWPLSKLTPDEVYFTKVGDVQGQAYFAILVPVRKPNQVPMVGVGIFPAAQFGLNFAADENREVRVFTEKGAALALTHPAYLGASLKNEALVHEVLDGDEVSLRHEWKSEHGVAMIGLASRISDSNLFAAIETKAQSGARLGAWMYLILCAIGAGIINWVLFSSVFRNLVAQISTTEETNEQLRRQLSETPRVGAAVIADPILLASELSSMEFIDLKPTTAATAPSPAPEPVVRIADIEVAETPPGTSSVARVVRAGIHALEKRIADLKISVMHFGLEDLILPGDTLQLQTAIEEVLKNAIESMSETSKRNLTISGHKHGANFKLVIEDTGCGIPEEDLQKVFDPFFSTKDSEGVARGLGLNVVRRVIEELQGTVKVHSLQSKESTGTRVEIEMPLDASAVVEVLPELPEMFEEEEFTVSETNAFPSVRAAAEAAAREWPEFSIRKPIVRSLD